MHPQRLTERRRQGQGHPSLPGQAGSSAYCEGAPGQQRGEPRPCGPLLRRPSGDSGTTAAAGCFPLTLQLIQNLQDPSSLATQGKKEEREEEKKEVMERCRERQKETESMALSWERQKEKTGEEGNLSPGRHNSSQNVEINTRG